MNKKNSNKSKNTLISNSLFKAVKQLVKLNEKVKALGIFVDDRELLECPKCGLMEDIDIYGRLFTVFEKEPNKDTGLRFKEIRNSKTFRCPNCGEQISGNVVEILEVK
ncbi:MAG: hypothetical protein AB1414_00385 [bacterium]